MAIGNGFKYFMYKEIRQEVAAWAQAENLPGKWEMPGLRKAEDS